MINSNGMVRIIDLGLSEFLGISPPIDTIKHYVPQKLLKVLIVVTPQ